MVSYTIFNRFNTSIIRCKNIYLVKPYIPYDIVPSDYKLPMATTSDGMPLEHRRLSVPTWIVESDIQLRPVHIQEHTFQAIEMVVAKRKFRNYNSIIEMVELIKQVSLHLHLFYLHS